MEENALRWFDVNKTAQTFPKMKKKFLKLLIVVKWITIYSLKVENRLLTKIRTRIFSMSRVTLKQLVAALRKLNKSLNCLRAYHTSLRAFFVRHRTTTVEEFTERLKDVSREVRVWTESSVWRQVVQPVHAFQSIRHADPFHIFVRKLLNKLPYQPVVVIASPNLTAIRSSHNLVRQQASDFALRNQIETLTNKFGTLMQNQRLAPSKNPPQWPR